MTVIVGIFDDARRLDQAIEALSDAGIDEAMFDQSIVSQETFSSVAGTFIPGSPSLPGSPYIIPGHAQGDPGTVPGVTRGEVSRLFRTHLQDYRLPEAVIESYAITFEHGGKFLIVKVDKDRAAEVEGLFRRHDAQVHRHG
ncbi:MAG: hypothetical protein M3Z21_10810 [Pseudomonadota bacterium]|nr:hypothetical protein [Pseudomonadota bacterium]